MSRGVYKWLFFFVKCRGCDGAEKGRSLSLRKTDPEYGTLVEYSKTNPIPTLKRVKVMIFTHIFLMLYSIMIFCDLL